MFTRGEQVSIKFGSCFLPHYKSRFKVKTMLIVGLHLKFCLNKC